MLEKTALYYPPLIQIEPPKANRKKIQLWGYFSSYLEKFFKNYRKIRENLIKNFENVREKYKEKPRKICRKSRILEKYLVYLAKILLKMEKNLYLPQEK